MKTSRLPITNTTFALCALAFLSTRTYASPPQYSVEILPATFTASQMNSAGQVAGTNYVAGDGSHASLWNGTSLITLGGTGTRAYGINSAGQVVGYTPVTPYPTGGPFYFGSSDREATLWSGGTASFILNDPNQILISIAYGINDSSVIWLTRKNISDFNALPVVTTPGTGVGDFVGYFGTISGISNSGVVFGERQFGAPSFPSFRPTVSTIGSGTYNDLSLLDGNDVIDSFFLPGRYGAAHDINSTGQIAGFATDGSSNLIPSAVIWNNATALPLVIGTGTAFSINDSGDVIGISGDQSAFFYTGGAIYDLGNLLDPSAGVTAIDRVQDLTNSGKILAHGTVNGQAASFILSPVVVPEPASFTLLLGGAAILAQRRRHFGWS